MTSSAPPSPTEARRLSPAEAAERMAIYLAVFSVVLGVLVVFTGITAAAQLRARSATQEAPATDIAAAVDFRN